MGNFYVVDPVYRSAHPAVIGVSGVNENNKLKQSNYGAETDVVTLSTSQTVADVVAKDAYSPSDGVSNASAIVAAQLAILKHAHPLLSQFHLTHCLMSSAEPVDEHNVNIVGQLGAGKTNLNAALSCANTIGAIGEQVRVQPKGSIYYRSIKKHNKQTITWSLKPKGEYAGVVLKPFFEGKPDQSELKVIDVESDEVVWQGLLTELPSSIESSNSALKLELNQNSKKKFSFGLNYVMQHINFSERFCKGQTVISGETIIGDGSSEINTDSVYLFSGEKTLQTNFLARISGSKLPHKMIVEGNSALLWFVSNGEIQGQGFKVRITNEPKVGESTTKNSGIKPE